MVEKEAKEAEMIYKKEELAIKRFKAETLQKKWSLEIMLQLNKSPFIIRVVHHVNSHLQPAYIFKEKEKSSGIAESAFKTITSVYQSVFGTQTKYVGLSYLGLEQSETAQKLLE
ncbi:14299_t:CDS:2 [Funneliformis geosporum]|nr:14299_t:CDS:2 [Funneliformis geosporum]